eukprot:scaffold7630_cov122-Isochrysis_galbana.AAC.8
MRMFLPRKTQASLVGLRCRLNSTSFLLVTLKPARSQRVCQPAFVVSIHVATAELARPHWSARRTAVTMVQKFASLTSKPDASAAL